MYFKATIYFTSREYNLSTNLVFNISRQYIPWGMCFTSLWGRQTFVCNDHSRLEIGGDRQA